MARSDRCIAIACSGSGHQEACRPARGQSRSPSTTGHQSLQVGRLLCRAKGCPPHPSLAASKPCPQYPRFQLDQPAVAAAARPRPLKALTITTPSSAPTSERRAAKAIEAISPSTTAAHHGGQKSATLRKPSSDTPRGIPRSDKDCPKRWLLRCRCRSAGHGSRNEVNEVAHRSIQMFGGPLHKFLPPTPRSGRDAA
jgi:hypothetical protein